MEAELLTSGFSCVLQMPTGGGKTWLAAEGIAATVAAGGRAIYLAPLRALADELSVRWKTRFEGASVGVFTGDYSGRAYPVAFADARVLIMTPERLDACTRAWRTHWQWIPEVDLLVVDELHLLADARRGARLEGAISRFRRLNPFTRILGLSATMGNREELAEWLDGVEYASSDRPVPLDWRVLRFRNAQEKPELARAALEGCVAGGGKSLVFVQSRRRAEQLSRFLQETGVRALHHHAGLTWSTRQEVEDSLREGAADVVVATATLEMGLNLPVRQVVLYDLQAFDGTEFSPLSTNSVWQRAGRAGRPGLDDAGEVLLLAPAWDRRADQYEAGCFEPIRSSLTDAKTIAEQIVAEVACGMSRSEGQLAATFRQSLSALQQRLPRITPIMTEMLAADMLRAESTAGPTPRVVLKATRLGRVATRHMLFPATVKLFRKALMEDEGYSFLDLLLVATSCEDCEPLLPVDFEEIEVLQDVLSRERSHLLQRPLPEVEARLGVSGKRLLAAIKMGIVARAWTRRGDAPAVAERLNCYPFEVVRLVESLERLLLAMEAVLEPSTEEETAVAPDTIPVREWIRNLRVMVTAGISEQAATLTQVRGIGPAHARRLMGAGVRDIEDLALADPTELATLPRVSAARAEAWIQEASDVIRIRPAAVYRESAPPVEMPPVGWPPEIDPYRLRRAAELSVRFAEAGTYRVTGGLEPHVVRMGAGALGCDCRDAENGFTCKHVLAVRAAAGDATVRRLMRQLKGMSGSARLDLHSLWMSGMDSPQRKML